MPRGTVLNVREEAERLVREGKIQAARAWCLQFKMAYPPSLVAALALAGQLN